MLDLEGHPHRILADRIKRQLPTSPLVIESRPSISVIHCDPPPLSWSTLIVSKGGPNNGYQETSSGNHRPDGPETGHALTFKVDHSNGADQGHCFMYHSGKAGSSQSCLMNQNVWVDPLGQAVA